MICRAGSMLGLLFLATSAGGAQPDWDRFRGPNGVA